MTVFFIECWGDRMKQDKRISIVYILLSKSNIYKECWKRELYIFEIMMMNWWQLLLFIKNSSYQICFAFWWYEYHVILSARQTDSCLVLSDERLGTKLRVTENRCVLFDSFTYIYSALLPQHWALHAKVDSTPTFILIYIYIYTHTYKFRKKAAQANTKKLSLSRKLKIFFPFQGPVRESNPGPLAPEARIIPLDQQAETSYDKRKNYIWRIPFPYVTNISVTSVGLQFTDL